MKESSYYWYEQIKDFCTILDPDGWDRTALDTSWMEKITKDEFLKRVSLSTVHCEFSKLEEWAKE